MRGGFRQIFFRVGKGLAQFGDAGFVFHAAGEKNVQIQTLQFVPQSQIFPGFLALLFQGLHPFFQFPQDVLHPFQIGLGAFQLSLGFVFAGLIFHNARCFFEHLAAILALGGEDFIDAALAHDGIAVPAQARIPEQVHDVLQPAGRTVDLIFAIAVAIHPAGNGHFRKIDEQRVVGVIKNKRHLAEGLLTALLGAVKDDVLHFRPAQGLGALFAKHPAHGVGNIGFSASIGAYHAGDAVLKGELHPVGKGFEPVDDQFFQLQIRSSLRSSSVRPEPPPAGRPACCGPSLRPVPYFRKAPDK